MREAADAVDIFGSGTPGFFGFARSASEAAVVVGKEAAQDLVGGIQIASASQAKFAGEAILKSAPEALDAAFGLGTLGGDVGDAELIQGAAELCGLAVTGELFFHRPVMVVANEDAVAVAVEAEGNAEAAQQAVEQAEIAARVFGGKEFGDENFAGGIVEEAQSGKLRAAIFQPVVRRAVEQQHFAFASRAQTALAMSGRPALAGRAEAFTTEQTAKGLAAQREAFFFDEFVVEVMVVETGIACASQSQDAVARALGQAAMAGASAADVCQSRRAALPLAGFESFDMSRRKIEQFRGSGTRQVPLHAWRNDGHSLQFLLAQRAMSPVSWGDIFTLPLRGDRIMELRQAPFALSSRGPGPGTSTQGLARRI